MKQGKRSQSEEVDYLKKWNHQKKLSLNSLEIRKDTTSTKNRILFLKGVGKNTKHNVLEIKTITKMKKAIKDLEHKLAEIS